MKATNTPTETTFNFWKENKISGHFQLTEKQLIQKFQEWIKTQKKEWVEYYSISQIVSVFVSDGLKAMGNTENEFREYGAMEKILKPVKNEYIANEQDAKMDEGIAEAITRSHLNY